jgi:hypothetical protein
VPRWDAPRSHYGPAPRHGYGHDRGYHYDRGYGHYHGHYYPSLPYAALALSLGGLTYYYSSGLFYRPFDSGYVVVGAPMGAVVPALPLGYRTVFAGRRAYYVVDNTYYLSHPQGYVVTDPPVDAVMPLQSYPLRGQPPEQQAQDSYECHRWGVEQSGFDPSLNTTDPSGMQALYERAAAACLQGRGYAYGSSTQ